MNERMLENLEIEENEENEELEIITCSHCGCVIEPSDDYIEFDDKIWCCDCASDELAVCDDCGELYYRDDLYFIENYDKYICVDCRDDYDVCGCCNEYIHSADAYYVDDEDVYVCEHCYNEYYYTCCSCGEIVHRDNIYYDEDTEEDYCYNCWQERQNRVIHDYYYKPEPIFYNLDNEDNKLYMGIELEIDKGGENSNNAEKILNAVNDTNKYIYIKHDGSLSDGFEIVSHPATLDYHIKNIKWEKAMAQALSMCYRSHDTNTCGLHIHISRNALGETEEKQEEVIARILYFVEKNWNSVLKFTRRTEENLNRWASRYGIEATIKDTYDKAKCDYNRYRCINLNNEYTIEFRMFRGTLKYSTLLATLQFVNTLCTYCIGNGELNWNDYVSSIDNVKHKELVAYLTDKELLSVEDNTDTDVHINIELAF